MNNPSPLLPQGATPPRGKSSLYFKVLMILTVHVVVIGGMLLQGCKDTAKDQAKTDTTTATPSDTMAVAATNTSPTNAPIDVPPTVNPNISAAYAGTAATAGPVTPAVAPAAGLAPAPKSTDLAAPSATGEAREYVIAKGDTFGVLARRNGVSVKALMEANPGVDAKKLRVGQKVQIPASAMAAASAPGATQGATAETSPIEGGIYVVKSGDMLLKIAKSHGTSVKKIMAMNDLKSTSIRAGQKLKLPAPKTSLSEPAATPVATTTVAAPVTAPARTSTVAAN